MTSLIEFENYTYRYPDGTTALSGFTMNVEQRERVGIVGPNGAGKTTALLALSGLIFGEGTIRIDGETLQKKNGRQLRSRVGLVFQNPDDQLFMPTVYEDVVFGPKNLGWNAAQVDKAAKEALDAVELPGYEQKSSHHLSSGEKKRVAIATVLAMQPDILVLDEPTTNLDPHARRRLMQLLASLEISTIIAGHDLELILELCTRAVIINNGAVIKTGEPKELFQDKLLMEENYLEVPYSLRKVREDVY
ncbi:MAG TPA: energy-coupling factor ABC transporter ATP-binding protein [bacterium]|nr:energy-coupling factor ABC transporter ATP-binding protein [bacterium]